MYPCLIVAVALSLGAEEKLQGRTAKEWYELATVEAQTWKKEGGKSNAAGRLHAIMGKLQQLDEDGTLYIIKICEENPMAKGLVTLANLNKIPDADIKRLAPFFTDDHVASSFISRIGIPERKSRYRPLVPAIKAYRDRNKGKRQYDNASEVLKQLGVDD